MFKTLGYQTQTSSDFGVSGFLLQHYSLLSVCRGIVHAPVRGHVGLWWLRVSNAEAAKLTKALLLDRQMRCFAPLSNAFPSSGTECSSQGSC